MVVFAALLLAQTAARAFDEIDIEKPLKLAPNEGVLLIASDGSSGYNKLAIESVRGGRGGKFRGTGKAGHQLRFIKIRAGTYRFSSVVVFGGLMEMQLSDTATNAFEIKPGMVNYAGTLFVNWFGGFVIGARVSNAAALEVEHLLALPAPALEGLRWHYAGSTPDPFLDLVQDYLAKHADARRRIDPAATYDYSRPDRRGLPPEELFRADGTQELHLSHDGTLIAELRGTGATQSVNLIDPSRANIYKLLEAPGTITSIAWANDQTLVVNASKSASGPRVAYLLRLTRGADGAISSRQEEIPHAGVVVDALENDDDHILFGFHSGEESDAARVYRVDIGGKRISAAQFSRRARLDVGLEGDVNWLFDRAGTLRLALTRKAERNALWFREDAKASWHASLDIPDDRQFTPLRFDRDGHYLLALSNLDREQVDLVRFDPRTSQVVDTLYSAPGKDLLNAKLRSDDDAPISVSFYRDGELVTQYLDAGLRHLQASMATSFPNQQVSVMQFDRARRHALVTASGPASPAVFYYFDAERKTLEEVARALPLLEKMKFRLPQVFTTTTADGYRLESIITLPDAYARAPLVVMPHGGPIGVRDTLAFNRDVQFLASRGYAVLQVNYRGSAGFGNEFLTAGYGNWGKRIEDDIEQALDEALKRFPLDANRVCMVGWSYGGYSALMALARAPERFRCAVSVAGVTDLPLMFSSSDWAVMPSVREMMKRIAGDPATELDKLQSVSPVYLSERITRPVLLIHGLGDARVAPDHTRRLRLLRQLQGIDMPTLLLPDEDHGISSLEGQIKAQLAIAHFLDAQIGQGLIGVDYARKPGEATPAPETAH